MLVRESDGLQVVVLTGDTSKREAALKQLLQHAESTDCKYIRIDMHDSTIMRCSQESLKVDQTEEERKKLIKL